MTGNLLSLGIIGLVQFVPTFAFAPFSGSVADRLDRRIVSIAGIGVFALLSAALYLYIRTDPTDTLPIYALMFAHGTIEAFQRPAARALPIDLSPENVLTRVMALNAATWQAGTIVGPVMAGFLFTITIAAPYAVFTGLFIVGGGGVVHRSVIGCRATGHWQGGGSAGATGRARGVSFHSRNPGPRGGDIPRSLRGSVRRRGGTAPGHRRGPVGRRRGRTRLASRRDRHRCVDRDARLWLSGRSSGRSVRFCCGRWRCSGLGTIALGMTRNFVVAIVALLVLGGADSISVFIRSTLVPLATPANMRGRVLALENVFIGASNELGAFESGVTAAWFGLVGAVLLGGFATMGVVAVFALRVPRA